MSETTEKEYRMISCSDKAVVFQCVECCTLVATTDKFDGRKMHICDMD